MGEDWELVFSYTNEQALEDGVFIDISKIARAFGFLMPFYATKRVFDLGEERLCDLLIDAVHKIHVEKAKGTMVVLDEPEGKIWVVIEGTNKNDVVMKIFFSEEY